MIRKHRDEESVQAALKLPTASQQRAFETLRKEGIYQKNVQLQSGDVHVDLIRERKQGDSKVVMCTGCKGFFGRRRICKHKKYHCSHAVNVQAETLNFSREPVAMATSEEFQYEVLNRFREDDAGSLCRKDKVILLIGQRAWAKSAKKERRVIMSEMRLLANVILQMQIVASHTFQGEDVLDRRNF